MPSDFRAWFVIIRPFNILLGGLSIAVGALIAGRFDIYPLLLACSSGMLVMAGGNVINDYFDLEVDAINKAGRPLPAGALSAEGARRYAIILFVLGIFLSIFITLNMMLIAVFVVFCLVLYSWKWKRALLIGNVTVSILAATAFIYGGLITGSWKNALIPAGFAFLFHLGREIIKDIEDARADKTVSARTLPIVFGLRTSLITATCVLAFLIVVTVIPYSLGIYNEVYFWTVLFGVDLILLLVIIGMWRRPTTDNFRRTAQLLKVDMAMGLLAVYLGSRL